ncbi:unnamed protein product [Durusdinium trenchii]|uniref:C2HC/C3H-type domain-containing protein n=3 Tax=Durusdinium trenchii TaxID=1381693 RepID=A0ABP0HLM8_9DINO
MAPQVFDALQGLCTPRERESSQVWAESPALPAWRPELNHWPQSVAAWQASCEGLPCGRALAAEDMEEIDRFLKGLEAPGSASASTSSSRGEVRNPGEPHNPDEERSEWAQAPDEPMEHCSSCGRSFWASRIEVHEAVCTAKRPQVRRVFESQRQRLRGLPGVRNEAKMSSAVSRSTPKPKEEKATEKKTPKALPMRPRSSRATPNRVGKAQDQAERAQHERRTSREASLVTPVKVARSSKLGKASSPAAIASKAMHPMSGSGREKELDTPPRLQKEKSVKRSERPFKELPEVRWPPEASESLEDAKPQAGSAHSSVDASKVISKLRSWAFSSEESLPARAEFTWTAASPVNEFAELHKKLFQSVESLADSQVTPSVVEIPLEPQEETPSEAVEMPLEPQEALFSKEESEPWASEESLATELFNDWMQSSSRNRLALVSEAAALCAEVDAMLGVQSESPDESSPSASWTKVTETEEPKESLEEGLEVHLHEFPPYDPSKYYEDDADEPSELQSWLKKCAKQIQQRRNEMEQR